MGIHYFTKEQIKEIEENPYVTKVSEKSITYSEEFKILFWEDYSKGETPSSIFRKYGFNTKTIGKTRIDSFTHRIKKEAGRTEGFTDTRKGNSGRPRTKDLTLEEENEILKQKLTILRQENDFLKRVRYINRRQIAKQSKNKP